MKTKIFVVSLVAGFFSATASALPPSNNVDIEIFLSGSSSQDNGIARLFADLCDLGSYRTPTTLDTYKDFAYFEHGKKHTAYFCEVDRTRVIGGFPAFEAANPGANPRVLLHKRSEGGSGMGVQPVIDETPITHMQIWNDVTQATNCTLLELPANTYSCTINNAGDTVSIVSDAGVSDVNPEMFVGANVPAGFGPVDAAVVASKMEVRPAAALVFGIPVTTNLRNALQLVQGKTVGAEDEANMPSLSKAEVAGIFAGRMKNWNQFKVGAVGLREAVTAAGGSAPSSTNLVRICTRTDGSGAKAQLAAKFLRYPCNVGSNPPASSGSSLIGPVVTLNSTSGYVDTCLTNAFTANQWAVGVHSTEKNVNNSLNYRFVKIDGVAPTINNAATGKYFDWVELTYQWRIAGALPLTGDKLNLMNTIATNAATTTIVRVVMNSSSIYYPYTGDLYSWGQGGYLSLATNGNAASFPFVTTNPVMPYTHTIGGGTDNCRSPLPVTNVGM